MDAGELYALGEWYEEQFPRIRDLYDRLIQPIQHNANQNAKLPIDDELQEVLSSLTTMDLSCLSYQQIKILDNIGVYDYISDKGVEFIKNTIIVSNYDSHTAFNKLLNAVQLLSKANDNFQKLQDVIFSLGLTSSWSGKEPESVYFRIGFQNEASIRNIPELKQSAADWDSIIRGISLSANEPPENTTIVSVSNGSIIITLISTAVVISILASISKNIHRIASYFIMIKQQINALRINNMLTDIIENDLMDQYELKKKSSVSDIINEVKSQINNFDGEKETALKLSIEKILDFNGRGGLIDFVMPNSKLEKNDGKSISKIEPDNSLIELRKLIMENNAIRDDNKRQMLPRKPE